MADYYSNEGRNSPLPDYSNEGRNYQAGDYSNEGRNYTPSPDYGNEGRNYIPNTIALPTVTVTAKRETIPYKVMIKGGGGLVRFEASAPVSESRAANYEGFNIVHLPTSLWAYRNTNGRHFSITGRLVSRTPNEAKANAGYLTTVRSWVLPNFGTTGSTPPIVFLTAYSNRQINAVPCVVLSYNWTFPDEVDYIYGTDEPMPVIGIITIELEEAYSAEQITNGEWSISPQKGGSFSYVGVPGSASSGGPGALEVNTSIFGKGFGGIAGSVIQAGGFPTLGGALTLSPGIIAKLPMMAAKVVGSATNSPLLSTVAQEAVGLLNNRFVSGSNPQNVVNNSNTGTTTSVVAPPAAAADPFGRVTEFVVPRIGGG